MPEVLDSFTYASSAGVTWRFLINCNFGELIFNTPKSLILLTKSLAKNSRPCRGFLTGWCLPGTPAVLKNAILKVKIVQGWTSQCDYVSAELKNIMVPEVLDGLKHLYRYLSNTNGFMQAFYRRSKFCLITDRTGILIFSVVWWINLKNIPIAGIFWL